MELRPYMKLVCEFTDGNIDPYEYMFEFKPGGLERLERPCLIPSIKRVACNWCIKNYCMFNNDCNISRTVVTLCPTWGTEYI